jgi:hypothetical protein
MPLETSFPNSTFFNRCWTFDIREKQEIKYPPRRAGERNKIESRSLGRIFISTELSLISCFLHLVSRVIGTLYLFLNSSIGVQRSTLGRIKRLDSRNKIESWSLSRIFISTELSLISCFLHLVSKLIDTLYLPFRH